MCKINWFWFCLLLLWQYKLEWNRQKSKLSFKSNNLKTILVAKSKLLNKKTYWVTSKWTLWFLCVIRLQLHIFALIRLIALMWNNRHIDTNMMQLLLLKAKILCTSLCKCTGCKNFEESPERKTLMHLADAAG